MKRRTSHGFTMVEMIVAMVMGAAVIGAAAMLVQAPVDAYFAQERRTSMIDESSDLTRRLKLDLARAVPRSVRVRNSGTRAIVEMLIAQDVALFHPEGSLSNEALELKLNAADADFAVFPHLVNADNARYMVVNHTGVGVYNAYRMTNVIAQRNFDVTPDGANDRIDVDGTVLFNTPASAIPNPPRIFFVSGPVSYICNSAAAVASLTRYEDYPITTGIPTSETATQLSSANVSVIATGVSACSFQCPQTTGNCGDSALSVAIALRRAADTGNEFVRVMEAIPFDNRP
jgi:prepilin-type N-terminal cleavage/methylation domain-containing protein